MRDVAILFIAICMGISMLIVSFAYARRVFLPKRKEGPRQDRENESENLFRRLNELQDSRFSSHMPPQRSRVPQRLLDEVLRKKEEG